jgi:hypothetical protein
MLFLKTAWNSEVKITGSKSKVLEAVELDETTMGRKS